MRGQTQSGLSQSVFPTPPAQLQNVVQVRNIFYQASNEEILEYMEAAGTIIDYSINKEDHRVMGQFTYADNESALCAAKMLDSLKICGSNRELKVKLCGSNDEGNTIQEENRLNEELDVTEQISKGRNLEESLLYLDQNSVNQLLGVFKMLAEQDEEKLTNLLAGKPYLGEILMKLLSNQQSLFGNPPPPSASFSASNKFDDLKLKKIGENPMRAQQMPIRPEYGHQLYLQGTNIAQNANQQYIPHQIPTQNDNLPYLPQQNRYYNNNNNNNSNNNNQQYIMDTSQPQRGVREQYPPANHMTYPQQPYPNMAYQQPQQYGINPQNNQGGLNRGIRPQQQLQQPQQQQQQQQQQQFLPLPPQGNMAMRYGGKPY